MRAISSPGRGSGGVRAVTSGGGALTPAQALVATLAAYSPRLLLVADAGTLQGDGTTAVSGDALTAATATWRDQSGLGNDATQATVTARPQLVAAAANGRAALVFDTVDDAMGTSLNVAVGTSGYSIVAVEVPSGAQGNLRTVNSATANAVLSAGRTSYQVYLGGLVYSGASASGGVPHVISLSCPAGGNAEAHLDGVNITNVTTTSNDWGTLTLGARGAIPEAGGTSVGLVTVVPYAARGAATALIAAYYGVTLP